MVLRGGTSKGAYFLAEDLPGDPAERDDLLLRLLGSPDPRQIDGIGGAHPLTSKVAVVSPSADHRADVDYLFLQVGVDQATVSDGQNCGNLLAGIGGFAMERGLIAPPTTSGSAQVGIRMVNSDSLATATFPVADGLPLYDGDTAISGVPGTAAPVRLDFDGLAGGTCGALLPSGHPIDVIDGVPCTLVDNGMPIVALRADALGVTGYESCEELEANFGVRRRIEEIRLQAGKLMNLGDVTDMTVPKMTLVAPPAAGGAIATRSFIPHRCHEAIGVLAAVSVATAAVIPDSPAAQVVELDQNPATEPTTEGTSVVVEHPTGTFEAVVTLGPVEASTGAPTVERAGIIRTARKLMDGTVFPRPARSHLTEEQPNR